MLDTDEAALDNPVYAALSGSQSRFALVRGRARRYQPDVTPFCAVPSDPSPADWQDVAELVAPGGVVAIMHLGVEPPALWEPVREFDVVQMVERGLEGAADGEAISLGAADVPEMKELVAETNPGPFLDRTIELGSYLGIRRDDRLVAMAGERLHSDRWREISGVCTSGAYRGHGLASRLVRAIVAGIHERSELAFLHVLASNVDAIRLYEQLGFRVRASATITVLRPEPEGRVG